MQQAIVTIKVQDLKVLAAKGLYKEELLLENHFNLSVAVKYHKDKLPKGEYLNYETLTKILQQAMLTNENLLENIAESILDTVYTNWNYIHYCNVKIEKLNPAFEGHRVGAVVVEIER